MWKKKFLDLHMVWWKCFLKRTFHYLSFSIRTFLNKIPFPISFSSMVRTTPIILLMCSSSSGEVGHLGCKKIPVTGTLQIAPKPMPAPQRLFDFLSSRPVACCVFFSVGCPNVGSWGFLSGITTRLHCLSRKEGAWNLIISCTIT